MPLGAARLNFLAKSITVAPVPAEVIRKKVGIQAQATAEIDTADYKFGGSSFYVDNTATTSHLIIDDASNTQLRLGTTFTVEGWFKPTSLVNRFWFFKGLNASTGMGLSVASDKIIFRSNGQNDLNYIRSDSGWQHIAFIYDGTDRQIWYNGSLVASNTISVDITSTSDITIGNELNTTFGYIGWIDEVRISSTVRYTAGFTPSTTPFVNDDDTLLLLHMNGSDGSTYFDDDNGVGRTRIDFSAINNAQIDTAQYKFGGSSAYFDGTNDWIEKGTDTLLDVATSTEFTYEMWIRPASVSGIKVLATNRDGNLPAGTFDISIWNGSFGGTRTASILIEFGGGPYIITGNNVVSANTWHHIACVRDSSNNIKIYVDGTDQTDYSQGIHANAYILNNDLAIGANPADIYDYQGHIDEFRVSDVCRYTSNFTPSTAPFVNDSNTKLLLHMNGSDASTLFLDDNGAEGITNTKTITAIGNAQLDTAQKKFGPTSALFDGSGDYLNFPADFSGDFTFEGWVRFNALPSSGGYSFIAGNSLGNNRYFGVRNESGTYRFEVGVTGAASFYRWWNTSLSTGTWYHFALVKNGTSLAMYQDGSSLSVTGSSGTMTTDKHLFNGGNGLIAVWSAFNQYFNGWIDELRISNTARYTSGFTPQTEAFENDTNTLLLLHMDGAYDGSTVFIDSSGDRTPMPLAANGNAQIDTAQSKIGGSSLLLDGTGDYLSTGSSILKTIPKLGLNYDYWTVEYWLRINSHAGAFQHTLGFWNATAPTGVVYYFSSNMFNGTNKMGFQYKYADNSDSGSLTFGSALSTGVWQHHAFVRNGNTLTAYLDGVSQGTHDMTGRTIDITGYNSTTISTVPFTIGAMSDAAGAINGWMDEIRISDVARYTSGFTPQTTPFQNDANTVLLLHCDGSDGDTDFVDDNGKEST